MMIRAAQDGTGPISPDLEEAGMFAREFERAVSSLTPTRQALLSLVYGQGMGKAEAGGLLGLRDYQVSRELSAAMESLRLSLEAFRPKGWSPQAVEAWTRVWTALERHPSEETDEPS